MGKINLKLGVLPLFLLGSHTAYADMAAINPIWHPVSNFVLLMIISLAEIFIIKFGLKISFWKSAWTVFIANVLTAIIGVVFFESFLREFHTYGNYFLGVVSLGLFLKIILIFIASFLIEAGVLGAFIKDCPFKKILWYSFWANLLSYIILIIIINIPHFL